MPATAFGERLLELITALGGRKSAAETGGTSPDSLDRYVRGDRAPFEVMQALCAAAGRSLDWLAGGDEPGQLQSQPNTELLTFVPRYDVRLSSGAGALVAAEEIFEHLAFRTSWLREMGISPQYAALVTNTGDSNEPTIPDGALMLMDLSIQQVTNGRFYGIRRGEELIMKRVQIRFDGTVLLISDNPRYAVDEVKPDRVPELHVIGQLRWIGRGI